KQGTFAVTAGASLLTAGLIIESAAGLHVSGNDVSFTAIGETVFNGGEILATEGSVVRLPDLIVLHGQGQAAARNRLEADGPGSLISLPQATALFSPSAPFAVRAIRGGQLLMENLDTIEGRV